MPRIATGVSPPAATLWFFPWTLKALHTKLGDDTFFSLVRAYTGRHRDSVASTADFIALAEEVSGQDLSTFFDEWLYGRVMPPMPGLGSGE